MKNKIKFIEKNVILFILITYCGFSFSIVKADINLSLSEKDKALETSPILIQSQENVIHKQQDNHFSQVHKFSSEIRVQTNSPQLKTGEDSRQISAFRHSLSSKFYTKFADDYKAHIHIKGYYDAIYDLDSNHNDTTALRDAYQSELEIREAYIQGSVSANLDFKIGRQITNWGYADFLRVADTLNPLDQREPGLLDLEDSRLPITMTRLDYFKKNWRVNLNLLHEFEATRFAPFGSLFYPFSTELPSENIPRYTVNKTGVGLRVEHNFNNADIALSYSDYYQPDFRFSRTDNSSVLVHDRIKKYAMSGQLQQGNWVIKAESSLRDGVKFFNSTHAKKIVDQLFGFEYQGWSDTQISVELQHQKILNYEDKLALAPDFAEEKNTQAVLALRRSFANDRWKAEALFYSSRAFGAFQRASLEKSINDQSSIRLGYVNYDSGSNALADNLGKNDTAFLKFYYTF